MLHNGTEKIKMKTFFLTSTHIYKIHLHNMTIIIIIVSVDFYRLQRREGDKHKQTVSHVDDGEHSKAKS